MTFRKKIYRRYMSWPKEVRDEVLIKSGRHCCICHKFCGLKIELHHIKLKSEGGEDSIDNCIPEVVPCQSAIGPTLIHFTISGQLSPHCILRKRPVLRWQHSQNNIRFRNTSRDKIIVHFNLGQILLNPYFTFPNFQMDRNAMDMPLVSPAVIYNQKVIAGLVQNSLHFFRWVMWPILGEG